MNWKAIITVGFWLCNLLISDQMTSAVGEGCIGTVANARAEQQPLQQDALTSAKSHSGKAKNMGYSKTGKRSFKRAFHRSIRDGFTTYHGRIFTPTDFNLPLPTQKPQVKSDVRMPSHKSSGANSRLSVFCWNMGGMSSDRYQCLLEWLRSCPCDVVCIQESHWKFTSTWTTEHYHAVHSGDTTSHAGLLTLISKKLLKAESLSWTERIPGRLVQLKLRGRSQDLDIIHCYQHVHKTTKMEDRDAFWTELQSTLASLPTRNRCCLMGDFNTTIPVANAKVGHKDFLHQGVRQIGPSHKDWKSFHHVIELFDLNILNSWADIGPTYEHEGGASRIDFILCRNLHTDKQSKQVKYLHHHPMYQTTGCRHVPMITTISSRWIPQQTQSPFHWNRHLKQSAYKHFEQNTTQWQQQVESIKEKVANLSMTEYVEDLPAFWALTTNMSEVADQLQLSDFHSTLYPTTSLNLTGGFYAQWLDDPTIVRLLRTRCCICDATFNDATDMFYHHNIAHGCLPKWYLRNFDSGLKTLLWHLLPITTLAISDQEILQLCQLVVLRIHCAFNFSHGGSGYLSADVGHLGGSHSKRPTETVHGYGRRGTGEKAQRSATKSLTRGFLEAPIQSDPDDDDRAPATRGLAQMSTGGYGVRHSPEHWRRKHSPRDDGSHQSLAIEQREGHATETPSGLHNGDYPAKQISEAGGIYRGQSTPTECQESQLDGHGWQVPLSGMEPRSEKAGDFENPSIDSGSDLWPTGGHSELPGGSKSHTSISQSQEAGWRSTEGSPIPLGGLEQGECRDLAPPAKAVLSRFLATYPDEFEAGDPSKISTGSTTSKEQTLSVRVFCNTDGVSCYMNSFCIGLAWLGLFLVDKETEQSATAFGAFLQRCVQHTLVPLDVHSDFKTLLGNWLNSNRKGIQQDIHEFAEFFMSCLQPVGIDGTWWPKWSLTAGPALDQPMDDYARGGKGSILSLTMPDQTTSHCNLQDLIHLWHDELGMCNVFTCCTAGKILHVNRQMDTMKDQRPLMISDVIQLPHCTSYTADTQWLEYTVRALTFHLGPTVENGHYRTMLRQHHPNGRDDWRVYEDTKLPDIVAEPTTFHLQNVTLIWLHRTVQHHNIG